MKVSTNIGKRSDSTGIGIEFTYSTDRDSHLKKLQYFKILSSTLQLFETLIQKRRTFNLRMKMTWLHLSRLIINPIIAAISSGYYINVTKYLIRYCKCTTASHDLLIILT